MRRLRSALLATVILGSCTTPQRVPATDIAMETTRISGWLVAGGGEWIISPIRNFGNFDPFSDTEPRCVSLVVDANMREVLGERSGRFVDLRGEALLYDELPLGTTGADDLLNKRFFRDVYVPNYCYRDHVFAVREVLD